MIGVPAAPETVALYLADLAGVRSTATLQRRSRRSARRTSPPDTSRSRGRLSFVRRGGASAARAAPPASARRRPARAMVATLDRDRLIAVRDRALLVIGLASAFRRF